MTTRIEYHSQDKFGGTLHKSEQKLLDGDCTNDPCGTKLAEITSMRGKTTVAVLTNPAFYLTRKDRSTQNIGRVEATIKKGEMIQISRDHENPLTRETLTITRID